MHVAECKLYLSRFGELKKKKVSNCHLPSLSQQLWEVRPGLLVRSIRIREFADEPRECASAATAPLDKAVGGGWIAQSVRARCS